MAFEEQQPFDPASFEHIPVLLNECLTGLAIDPAYYSFSTESLSLFKSFSSG